ncbi:MAG: PAS domain S-box protein [Candidatus Thermoplasmatota archaeon]
MEEDYDIVEQLRKEEREGKLYNKSKDKTIKTVEKKRIQETPSFENKKETDFEEKHDFNSGLILINEDEKIVAWSKNIEELLGFNKYDLYLKQIQSFYPEENWQKIKNKRGNCFVTNIVRGKDNKKIEVNTSVSNLKNSEESSVGKLVVLKKNSGRENIEKESNDFSNLRYKEIFEASSDFLVYFDTYGRIIDVNQRVLEFADFEDKKEVVGKSFSVFEHLFSGEGLKKHVEVIRNGCRGITVKEYESELFTKDDSKYRFLFSTDLIKEDEEVKGILFRGRDVTQRQRAWDELVKLEERYRVLAETSADGVITVDELGRLTYVNPSFEKICGRRKSQMLATLFREYLSDESIYLFQQVFIDTRKEDKKVSGVELEVVRPNHEVVPIEANVAPIWKEGDFSGMICTIRDITERKKVEEELKKSEKLKTEFMNIAAHELKSPVTPIKGYLDLIISDEKTSEDVKKFAKISLRNAERLLKLVNDILDVSRLDTDTMRFDMERIDTVEILEEIVEDMKPVVENKGLDFNVEIPDKLSDVMGDRYRLSQVLKNLMSNALKFTDEGSITIKAEDEKDHVLISVIDTGVGMSKEESKNVFSKFYQADTGEDRKNEGTGLGLFICKQIVEKHNGEIWVGSEVGEGSTFNIKLPHL